MRRTIYLIYLFLIGLPLFFIITIITALAVMIISIFTKKAIASYIPGKLWSKATLFLFGCPTKITRKSSTKLDRPCIIVTNHQSAFDIFLLYATLEIPFKWVMKASLKKLPFVGAACKMAGFIFVDEQSINGRLRTIKEAEQTLKENNSIAIFPEGARTLDGHIKKFKKGAFKMALDLNAPILPISLNGPYKVLKRGKYIPHAHKLHIIIHPIIEVESIDKEDPRSIINLTNQTFEVITSSLDECYQPS